MYSDSPIPNVDIDNDVFALDSTTVSLSLKLFAWAEVKYSRGAIKIHTMLNLRGSNPTFILITDGKYHNSNVLDEIVPQPDAIYLMDKANIDFASLYRMNRADAFFVTRAKVTMDYRVLENNFNLDKTNGLRSDRTIKLKGPKSKQLYPDTLRMVEYYDDEKDLLLTFITNNFEVSALEIARLYRNRWQIEVFRMVKQNLKIKSFIRTSENAVLFQIWSSLITILLLSVLKTKALYKWHMSNMVGFIRLNLFVKIDLFEWLNHIFLQDKEPLGQIQLELF